MPRLCPKTAGWPVQKASISDLCVPRYGFAVAQVRCLLSRADPAIKRQKERETQYSLEAISLNGTKSWIDINQSAVTRYFSL